jgi:hypothetical protein
MMKNRIKTSLVGALMLLTLYACKDYPDTTPEYTALELHENSRIVSVQVGDNEFYQLEEGQGTVAVYRHVAAQSNSVYDDEFMETLSFELPTDGDGFSLKDGQLEQIKAFYRQEGAWPMNPPGAVMKGTISGSKISGNLGITDWEVNIDIEMQNDGVTYATVKASGVLVPQQ